METVKEHSEVSYQAVQDGRSAKLQSLQPHPPVEVRFRNVTLSTPTKAKPVKKDGEKTPTPTRNILDNVSGSFKPGTMTLVLGQPGAGKSALLRILAGRLPLSKTLTLEGDISYNGISRDQLLQTKRMPHFVSYVAQTDQHFPTLTVKETLQFAQQCCGDSQQAEDVTKQLGLDLCQDTPIGDGMLRGVSGGERKRVTVGEMEFGNNLVAFMDEISTGLDSAATFDIVSAQRRLATTTQKTIVMALLQPGPEVFELFDDVMLMAEGHVLYHGPRERVVSNFQSLGLERPRNRDVADFLIDIGTPKQSQYLRNSESFAYISAAMAPADLAASFRESAFFQSMLSEQERSIDPTLNQNFKALVDETPEFLESFFTSTAQLVRREIHTSWRNREYITGRFGLLIIVGLIEASLFYNLDLKKIEATLGALAAVILYIVLTQPALSPIFVNARSIFYKQRDANFYRSSSYVSAVAFNQMLFSLPEAFIFTAIVYWMFGFVSTASGFLGMTAVIFLTSTAFCSSAFFFSTLCATAEIVESATTLLTLIFTLFAGIFITRVNIPSYLVWAYWVNPIAWALRAISVQQYTADELMVCVYDGIDYCTLYGKPMGTYTLESFDIFPEEYWFWAGIGFLAAMSLMCYTASALVLDTVRLDLADHEVVAEKMEGSNSTASDTDSVGETSIQGTKSSDVHIAVLTPRASHSLSPVTLAFEDIRYSVPDPNNKGEHLQLLNGISGFAKPGTITALMGSTGAGKTTLMDVIAGRKTGGNIQGRILLNGYEASDVAIRRSTGYCEQANDNHCETATVREALTFSAFLRQSADVSDVDKHDAVEECLDLLNLRPIADKILRGSSPEQMKRVAIGVELAAHTSVLFLDEPTSGLDARAAKLVMDAVRKVANSGRTVVCTIHQPSWEVVQDFDSLLLLKRGGEAVFFGELGPDACELIQYLESIDGVAPMEKGANPATWMLDVIGAGLNDTNAPAIANEMAIDFVSIFQASEKKRMLDWELSQDGMKRPKAGVPAVAFTGNHAASHFVQAKLLLARCALTYWRSIDYNATRLGGGLVLALLFGLSFGKTEFETFKGLYAVVTMIGVAMVFLAAVSFDCVIPFTIADRPSFYRERASHTYSTLWYCFSSTIIEIPYIFTMGLLFSAVFFPLAGFAGASQFVLFWVHMSLHLLLQTYIGQTIAFAAPSVEVATTWGLLVTSISFLFMGFNPPRESIPAGYKWLHTIVPPKYTMAILTSVVAGECSGQSSSDVGCIEMQGAPPTLPAGITNAGYLDLVFDVKRDELWTNFAVIAGYIVLTRVVALIVLRYIKQEKR